MAAGLQLLSSRFWGSVQSEITAKRNKGNHNILGVASAYKNLLKRAIVITSGISAEIELIVCISKLFRPKNFQVRAARRTFCQIA
jgi:hypothetical protein